MSIDFNGTTSNAYYATLATLTSSAITISMWVQIDQVANGGYLFEILNATDGVGALYFRQDTGDPTALLFSRARSNYASFKSRLTSTAFLSASSSTWVHLAITDGATFTDGTQIHIYKDGSEASYAATNNGSATPQTLNGDWVIGWDNQAGAIVFDGRMAEIAVWNTQQPASVIGSLAAGFSPLLYPNSLLLYVPGLGGSPNNRRGPVPTSTADLTAAEHVRQFYPATPLLGRHFDAAGGNPPSDSVIHQHQYRRRRIA